MAKSKSVPNDPSKPRLNESSRYIRLPMQTLGLPRNTREWVELGEVPITVSRERQKRRGERDG
jgi:hypothetical protein